MHNMLLKYIVFALIIVLVLKAVPNLNMDTEKIIKVTVVGTVVLFLVDRFVVGHGFGYHRGHHYGPHQRQRHGHAHQGHLQAEAFEGCTPGGMTDIDMTLDAGTMPELRAPMHVPIPQIRQRQMPATPVPTLPVPVAVPMPMTMGGTAGTPVANLAPANVPSANVPSMPIVYEMEEEGEEEGEEEEQEGEQHEAHMQALIDLAHATGPYSQQHQEQEQQEQEQEGQQESRIGVEGMDVVTMTQPGSPTCDGPLRFPKKYNFTYLDEDYATTGLAFDNNRPNVPLLQQCGFSKRIAPLNKMHQILESQRYNKTDETKPGYYLSNNGKYSCGDVPYSKVGDAICASKFNDLYNQYNHARWSPHTHLGKARGYVNWEKFY